MAFDSIYRIAGSSMNAQTVRLNTVASNLANADSAAASAEDVYQARKPVFAAVYNNDQLTRGVGMGGAHVQVLDVVTAGREPVRRYEPDNPLADTEGYVRRPDIDLGGQMAQLMMAQRSYQANLSVVDRARESYQAAINLGKA